MTSNWRDKFPVPSCWMQAWEPCCIELKFLILNIQLLFKIARSDGNSVYLEAIILCCLHTRPDSLACLATHTHCKGSSVRKNAHLAFLMSSVVLCSTSLFLRPEFFIFLPNMEEANICSCVASTLFVDGCPISGLLGQLHCTLGSFRSSLTKELLAVGKQWRIIGHT